VPAGGTMACRMSFPTHHPSAHGAPKSARKVLTGRNQSYTKERRVIFPCKFNSSYIMTDIDKESMFKCDARITSGAERKMFPNTTYFMLSQQILLSNKKF